MEDDVELHENRTELERLLAAAWEYEHRRPRKTSPRKWLFALTLSGAVLSTYAPSDVYTAVTTALAPARVKPTVDAVAAADVAEDLDYRIAQHAKSLAGWHAFLEAHRDGPHAQAAHAEIERLLPTPLPHADAHGSSVHAQAARVEVEKALLAEKAPSPAAAPGSSDDASPDAKAASEVVDPPAAGAEVAHHAPDESCKPDEDRRARLQGSHTSDDAERFANELSCETWRPQPLAASFDPTAPGPAASNGVSLGADVGPAQGSSGMEVAALTPDEICKRDGDRLERLRSSPKSDEAARFANELGCQKLRPQLLALMESLDHVAPAPAAAHPRPSEKVGSAPSQKWREPVRPNSTRWTASRSLQPRQQANKSVARRIVDRRTQLITMWLDCPVEETDDRRLPLQGCLLLERP
jgi:hypothetical protein